LQTSRRSAKYWAGVIDEPTLATAVGSPEAQQPEQLVLQGEQVIRNPGVFVGPDAGIEPGPAAAGVPTSPAGEEDDKSMRKKPTTDR
jgi:hypothetical protein